MRLSGADLVYFIIIFTTRRKIHGLDALRKPVQKIEVDSRGFRTRILELPYTSLPVELTSKLQTAYSFNSL